MCSACSCHTNVIRGGLFNLGNGRAARLGTGALMHIVKYTWIPGFWAHAAYKDVSAYGCCFHPFLTFLLEMKPSFGLFFPLCHCSILFQICSAGVWCHSTHQIHDHVPRLLSWQDVVNVPLTTARTGCSGCMWALTAILKWPFHVCYWICEYINECMN